ncbi:MAG TPA: penicillin acylase family protein, partial [Thermoleophilaceae bacterium]|nr:penicillin acylase family protein [Thermoleophilaceae bacterium]
MKLFLGCVAACLVAAPTASAETARYILPPGNFGGLPTSQNSLDQLPLYDGLTPLRGNVSAADVNRYYIPEDFNPIGITRTEVTGRAGLRLVYDSYGVPHIYGNTRDDLSFGAGWVTARDRGLLLNLGRGPARVAVADVPGIDAFSLVTSGKGFAPSKQAEALVTKQKNLLVKEYGAKGRAILRDAQAYIDGANAYQRSKGMKADYTVNDVIATTAFIGSIFGAGGGGEASNGDLLARLRKRLGNKRGTGAWKDVMLADDPEAPTTISKTFKYGPRTGGKLRGSVVPDAGTLRPFDPLKASKSVAKTDALAAPARRRASNFLITAPSRSATGKTLAVMGPQLGYYYPEIVQQMHMQGAGINAQGAFVPGLSMYMLLGRTNNYAWSLTSAGHDVRDTYALPLCGSKGKRARQSSKRYRYKGKCRSFTTFNAGKLGGKDLKFKQSVQGPVIGTATVKRKAYAFARKRSTFGRDALNLAALKDMTEGRGSTPAAFMKSANQFGFTFNWGYINRTTTANFSSGRLPVRPKGLDRRLPTLGTGKYNWKGFLKQGQHPNDTGGP